MHMPGTMLTHAASFSLTMLSASFLPAQKITLSSKHSTRYYDIQRNKSFIILSHIQAKIIVFRVTMQMFKNILSQTAT